MEAKHQTPGGGIALTDDGWFHTKATVTLLYLAICQIETSIAESNQSIQQLTDTFTGLAERSLADSRANHNDLWTSAEMRERINQAITAFQFYDRINQRLQHVANGLEKMSNIFNDIDKLNNPSAWHKIQTEVEASYSMEGERLVFQKIMEGASVQEAMAFYQNELLDQKEASSDDDIELF